MKALSDHAFTEMRRDASKAAQATVDCPLAYLSAPSSYCVNGETAGAIQAIIGPTRGSVGETITRADTGPAIVAEVNGSGASSGLTLVPRPQPSISSQRVWPPASGGLLAALGA
jgi:hypothetical protein